MNLKINNQQPNLPTSQEKQDFARHRLMEILNNFMEFDMQDFTQRPEPNKDLPIILHDDNLPKFGRQPLSQAQMSDACEAIREKVRQSNWLNKDIGFNAELNFLDFTLKCGGDTFYLGDTVVCYSAIGDEKTIGCGFLECYRMDVQVFVGGNEGATRAFVRAERATNEYQIAELSEFGMMSTFEADGRNFSIATLYDKLLGLNLFVITDSPRKNHWSRTDIPVDANPPLNRGEYAYPVDYYTMFDEPGTQK